MSVQEIMQQISDRTQNLAGLIGQFEAGLAKHSDTVAAIPRAEAQLAALTSAAHEVEVSLAEMRAEYAIVKAAYEDLRAKFGA